MWPHNAGKNRNHTGILGTRNISSCDHHGRNTSGGIRIIAVPIRNIAPASKYDVGV